MVKPENPLPDKPYLVVKKGKFRAGGRSFRHQVDSEAAEDDDGDPEKRHGDEAVSGEREPKSPAAALLN